MRFTHRLLITVLLPIQVTPSFCLAQAPAAKPSLVGLYQAVGAENYPEAKRQADALLPTSAPAEKLKISLCYGRILLGLKLKEPARQYLTMMAAQKLDGDGQALMEVYAAWLESLDGKTDAAIKKLEAKLQAGHRDAATLEAADILAMLYLSRGNQEGAKRAVDFGLGTLKYLSLLGKTDYIESLLRGRLESGASDAEKLFKAAKKLQEEGNSEVGAASRGAPELAGAPSKAAPKFTEAGKLFNQLIAEYPRSEWLDPANFHLGQCLVSLDRAQEAFKHWKKFIEEKPAGPWRGQTRVAIIDLALEKNLDVKMASEHAMAATAVLAKVPGTVPAPSPKSDKESADTSWQDAAFDIHLRQGIVSLVDGRYDAAATAFKEAGSSLATQAAKSETEKPDNELLVRGLERLTKAAHDRAPVLPKELAGGEARTVTALALGNVYCVINDYPTAQKFFQLILSGNNRSSSAPHRAFASFGLARTRANLPRAGESQLVRFEEAKTLCQQSWNEYKPGSWHDETLFRTATLIQELASAKFPATKPVDGKREPQQPAKHLTAKEREAQAKAETERKVAMLKAQREALPYWQKIVKQFPESPRCEQALYHVGVVQYETAAATTGKESEQKWKEATASFSRLCEAYPRSSLAGDAYVRQIDIALEWVFDPARAAILADQGVGWAKNQKVEVIVSSDGTPTHEAIATAEQVLADDDAGLPSWSQMGVRQGSDLLEDLYNLYLRAGILAYLDEEYEKATTYLNAAGPARPTEGSLGRFDVQKAGTACAAKYLQASRTRLACRGGPRSQDRQSENGAQAGRHVPLRAPGRESGSHLSAAALQ